MKSVIMWVVALAIVGGAGAYGLVVHKETVQAHAYETELNTIKAQFIADSNSLLFLDEETYRKEVGTLLTRYFREIAALGKKFPENQDIARETKRIAAEVAAGRMNESQQRERQERIDMVTKMYEKMLQGQYRPLYTKADKNFRFDLHDITAERVQGNPRVKFSYLHWAPFGPKHKPNQGPVSYNSILGNIRAEQQEGKPVAIPQIVGDSQPPSLQVNPSRWVAEFPPGVEIGYYDLPLFPAVATGIELTFGFGLRTIGGSSLPIDVQFPEIAVPAAWKVGADEKWDGKERFADDDELKAAGVDVAKR